MILFCVLSKNSEFGFGIVEEFSAADYVVFNLVNEYEKTEFLPSEQVASSLKSSA
jgi:hypothetical protein